MPAHFRQLERGTYCLHSLNTTLEPGGSTSTSGPRPLMRDHADDPTLVGYAMVHGSDEKLVETWVLFGHYQPPRLDAHGNSTAIVIHRVQPQRVVRDFKPQHEDHMPTLKAFVDGALLGRTDRDRCTVMQNGIKILNKDRLPRG